MTAFPQDGSTSDAAWWTREELAWPVAILLGFGGTWSGLAVGHPWLAIAIAAGLVVPLQSLLARRDRTEIAALTALGWLAGIAGAAAGAVIDSDAPPWSSAVAGEAHYRAVVEGWLAADRGAPSATWMLVHGGLFATAIALARWSRGATGAAGAALGTIALSTVAANLALPAIRSGRSPLVLAVVATPPHLALELVALSIGGAVLASPGTQEPAVARRRRVILGVAAALEAACLASGAFLGDEWGRWASAHLAGR